MLDRLHTFVRRAGLAAGLLLVAATGSRAAHTVPAPGAGGEPPADASVLLYACNQDDATVTVIDTETLEVVHTVDLMELGFSANAKPHHAVVEPDGSHWYVSLIGENRVLKFDRENRLVAQAAFEVPGLLALHPTEDLLFVGRSMSAVNPPKRIGVFRRSTMEPVDEIEVLYPRPHALAVRPQGDWVYSASLAVNQMAAVDPAEGAVELASLEGPTHTLVQFAVSPDGGTLVATGQLTATLLVFDLADPAAPRLTRMVDVGAEPWHPVFSPDGGTVWFANKADNTVTAVDTETWTVAAVVEGDALAQPHGAAISPDGRYVFISNNNKGENGGGPGHVAVIDAETGEVVKRIPTGRNAAGLGIAMPE